jgi:hypothetical protein
MTAASNAALPLEHFIQAVQSQLDNAQTAMAVKARNLNLPLTFAIKDITLDLRAQVEFTAGEIRIRPAGAADVQASMFHLVFTAITRPMIEENAIAFSENPQDRSIDELGDDLSDEDRRKLEWVGVRTVGKLQEISAHGGDRTVGRVTSLPVDRLRRALERASAPLMDHVIPVPGGREGDVPLLRVGGRNLMRNGPPRVTLGGEPIAVVKASANELLLAPAPHQWAGELAVEPAPQVSHTLAFDLRPYAPAPPVASPSGPPAAPPFSNGAMNGTGVQP